MQSKSPVEIADSLSRKRAIVVAVATIDVLLRQRRRRLVAELVDPNEGRQN